MFSTVSRTVIGTIGTALFAGTCLFAATAPAAAQDAPRAKTVAYSDLNLSSSEGRQALDRRIKQAARSVCFNGSGDLAARSAEARCVRVAVEGAVAKVALATAAANAG